MQVNDAPRHWLRWGSSFFLVKISPHAYQRLMLAMIHIHSVELFRNPPLKLSTARDSSYSPHTGKTPSWQRISHTPGYKTTRQCRIQQQSASLCDTQCNNRERDNCDKRRAKVMASNKKPAWGEEEWQEESLKVERCAGTTKLSLADLVSSSSYCLHGLRRVSNVKSK